MSPSGLPAVSFKAAVVRALEELRRRHVISPLPEDTSRTESSDPPSDEPVPYWVCKVCGNPNHLSRQFCFMQVCGAPRSFPGPYIKAVRPLPPPDAKAKRRAGADAEALEHPARTSTVTPPPGTRREHQPGAAPWPHQPHHAHAQHPAQQMHHHHYPGAPVTTYGTPPHHQHQHPQFPPGSVVYTTVAYGMPPQHQVQQPGQPAPPAPPQPQPGGAASPGHPHYAYMAPGHQYHYHHHQQPGYTAASFGQYPYVSHQVPGYPPPSFPPQQPQPQPFPPGVHHVVYYSGPR